jgi:hypothetical protein
MSCSNKIVVFDLDETLGYFVELGMFWDALQDYLNHNKADTLDIKLDQHLFNEVLDLYPEFLRPNIVNILNYLKKKKERTHCSKIMIYTNNQGPEDWAKYIIGYFENKLDYKIFDQIIAAFKVNGKHVEICRTTHMKTHQDLIRCTQIPENTSICFLDDVFYPAMSNHNIYYINIKPYTHDLSFDTMIKRFIGSNILTNIKNEQNKTEFHNHIFNYMKRYRYTYVKKDPSSLTIDKILSKKIMHHLKLFFSIKSTSVKTRRHKSIKNKTQKIHKKLV